MFNNINLNHFPKGNGHSIFRNVHSNTHVLVSFFKLTDQYNQLAIFAQAACHVSHVL